MLDAGVIRASIGFSEQESWSFSNVVSLSGLHAAWPIADGMHGSWDSPSTALLEVDVDVQRQLDALPQAVNVSGKWLNDVDATRWALEKLWPSARNATRLVVAQVIMHRPVHVWHPSSALALDLMLDSHGPWLSIGLPYPQQL